MAGNDDGLPAVADVIVVGSGSGGAVVARRLVDAGAGVVLLEAGDVDHNPAIHDPPRLFELWDSARGLGVPHGAAGRLRRTRAALAAREGAGWIERPQRDDLRARSSQRLRRVGVSRQRGLGVRRRAPAVQALGGLRPGRVRLPRRRGAAARAVALRAASAQRRRRRSRAGGGDRRSTTTTTARASTASRSASSTSGTASARAPRPPSSAPSSGAPNLTVLTGARARRLLFEGERCSGIELVREGVVSQIRAEAEVVVCGGTVESPKLLLLSGIGPAGELAALGIDVVSRSARRRAQPARPRALAGHPRRVAARPAGAPRPATAAQPPLLAQPTGPGRAGCPAALLPSPALPGGDGGAGRRLHPDGRDHPPGQPRVAAPGLDRPGRPAADRPGLPQLRGGHRRPGRRHRALP